MGTDLGRAQEAASRRRRGAGASLDDDISEAAASRSALRLPNLLNDAETLVHLLVGEVGAGRWLDAFLLAAGLDQILEDALHTLPLSIDRIALRLETSATGGLSRAAAGAAGSARALVWTLRRRQLSWSDLARCEQQVAELSDDLANLVIGGGVVSGAEGRRNLHTRTLRLKHDLARLPSHVRQNPLRLPSAFRHHDLCPEDVKALMGDVVERWPDPERPVLVVGVRTAGSYLAPLAGACLRALGRRSVRCITLRPGQAWLPKEQIILRRAAATDALLVLLDDPPNTWTTVTETVQMLTRAGIERRSIVPALQTFPTTSPVPASLQGHPIVLMSWERSHIQTRLAPEAVKASLQALLEGGGAVRSVSRVSFDPRHGARGHVGAQYEVELSLKGRATEKRLIYLQGIGLGYFGMHALAISERLQSFLPQVYGADAGLLFRDWLPEELRLSQTDSPDTAAGPIVDYVRARAMAFPVADDVSRRLKARPSLWRGVGRFLARPFGRAQMAAWPFLQAGVRELLSVEQPSVIDARTGLPSWFRESPEGLKLKKIGFADWAFSAFDTLCYDPVFDLAGAAASDASGRLDKRLLQLYTRQTKEPVDPERWLLYQLVHLSGQQIESEVTDPEVERQMSSRFQRYFGGLLLGDEQTPSKGPLCAVDLDGVLESTPLGVSATSFDGAMALRALDKHGYRPVIATGRSLAEVRERCANYRAAGGVGEYGAAIYVTATDRAHELLTEHERESLDRLRSALARTPGVVIDRSFRLAVRAYRLDRHGRRRALGSDQVQAALAAIRGQGIRAIAGQAQTDFMVERVTKATGLEALADHLGTAASGRRWLAMAVGDTASDLPMLRLATRAFAPANADEEVRRAGITVLRRACQAGLADATTRLLGHRPGRCPICREPRLSSPSRLLLTLLSPPDQGSARAKATWSLSVLARLTWHLGFVLRARRSGSRITGRLGRQAQYDRISRP